MTCSAFSNGATAAEFFDAVLGCSEDVIRDYIVDEVEKRVKPQLCEVVADLDGKIRSKLARVVTPLRAIRVAVDSADGLVTDLEDFSFLGLRVPRAITRPLRRLVDNVIELLDTVDEGVASVIGELDILKGYCDDEGQD